MELIQQYKEYYEGQLEHHVKMLEQTRTFRKNLEDGGLEPLDVLDQLIHDWEQQEQRLRVVIEWLDTLVDSD